MPRSMRRALLGLAAAAVVIVAGVGDSSAGCAPVPTAGGDIIVCDAAIPPNPAGPISFLGGNDSVTVNSGTYGAFTFPSGSNTLIFGPSGGNPVLNGAVTFGDGADRMEVHSGTIIGKIDQAGGLDTFIMTGGTIIGNVEQSGDRDTFFMSGGVITGAFVEGDVITITGGQIGSVNMNIGNNIFDMSGGKVVGDVIGFGNDDTFKLSGTGFIGGNVDLGNGNNSFTITGGQIVGNVSAGPGTAATPGTDNFTWDGGGTIGGSISLGAGNDTGLLRNLTPALLTMKALDGGSGSDTLTFDSVVSAGVARYQNWETISITNGSQITLDANLVLGDGGAVLPTTPPTVVPPTNTGTVSIDATSTLFAGGGVNPSILPFAGGSLVTVTNAGLIDLTNGGSGATDTLTIAGNYVGAGGRLALQTVLGPDLSPSDRLVISGAGATGSGTTTIGVTNLGGSGALTLVNGIEVVTAANGAATQSGAFSLAGGTVSAGPFVYVLFKGGVTPGSENNWYLRSTVPEQPTPAAVVPTPTPAAGSPPLPSPAPAGSGPIPLFRPEVSVQAVVPGLARAMGLATLGTYHERMGVDTPAPGWHTWGRLLGQQTALGFSGTVRPDFDGSIRGFQAGSDVWAFTSAGHRDHVGLYGAFAQASGDVRGFAVGFEGTPVGRLSLDATSFGGYWTHIGPTGWYLDTVLQGTWLDGNPRSNRGIRADASGDALAASLEAGYPLPIGWGLVLEPQAQVIWQHLSLDTTSDLISTINFETDDAWTGRVGARLGSRLVTPEAVWLPYLKTNVWWGSGAGDTLLFAAFPISAGSRSTSVEVGGGLTAKLGPSVSIYGEASYLWSVDGVDIETTRGTAGLRVTW